MEQKHISQPQAKKYEKIYSPERERFARHYALPEVGEEGQRKLRNAKVLVVGVGGLGSPVALYLAAAGVGTIGIVDFDRVELSNLQRQVLFVEVDVGEPKTRAAARRLRALNAGVWVVEHNTRFSAANGLDLLEGYDLVLDGTDNFTTRYLLNDACLLARKPFIYGSVSRFTGFVSAMAPWSSACYRCLYPEPPPPELLPNCAESGVLGVVPGSIALLQATEALKTILGLGEPLFGRALLYEALSLRTREIKLTREPECAACAEGSLLHVSGKLSALNKDAAWIEEITSLECGAFTPTICTLIDVREPIEFGEGSIPGALSIPLGQVPLRAAELDPSSDIVVFCQSGLRSQSAAILLKELGFKRVRTLAGGFAAYKSLDSTKEKK